MPSSALIFDSTLLAGIALVLALIAIGWRRDLRKAMITWMLVMIAGLAGLWWLDRLGGAIEQETLIVVLREVALLIVAIGIARITLMFLFEGLLARFGVPHILDDVLTVLTLIVFVLYRMNVAGVNLASIITTSAIISGVIAFSLQESLGNLWGGIALQLDNTCRIGDWIRVDKVTGKIVGIRWRYVAIATNEDETILLPNSALIKQNVTVLGRRGDLYVPWRRKIEFTVAYDVPPSRVIAVVRDALVRAETQHVARSPEPTVNCLSFDASAIRYVAFFWVEDPAFDEWVESQVRLHVYAALARHGMEIPLPKHQVVMTPPRDQAVEREEKLATRQEMLGRLELLALLTEGERRAMAGELVDCPYVAGDIIFWQGEVAESLFILARGRVEIFRATAAGNTAGTRARLATMEAPAHFGEMGMLTGQARTATAVAVDEVLCYRLDKKGFDAIVIARPELAEALSKVLAARQAANDATLQSLDAEARARHAKNRAEEILRRIQSFFGLES